MATAAEWLEGARFRTLPASSSPVVAGSGLAWFVGSFSWWKALLCLVVALAIQIGCNFANDYSDGIRGSDTTDKRVGPLRLVGSGKATPAHVKLAAFAWFFVACCAGLALAVATGHLWLIAVGAASVLAAWFYTGGQHPYGYAGWGEAMVFLFFGFIAFFGTAYVQNVWPVQEAVAHSGVAVPGVPPYLLGCACAGATAMGCLATAILVTNNLRDIAGDAAVGKRTLATRMGDRATRWFDIGLVVAAGVAVIVAAALSTWWALAGLVGLALLVKPSLRVLANAKGRELIMVLKLTGMSEFAVAAGLTAGWVIGR
ncbi:MAG: 1,4-dihydroxy-2-naphthoate polyprenyltransferase [Propionibacteriaceae bacterium]|jgi:1,4-dihydroxy-2-naphthoate octaprenyltransferase|nr:1,4-dihydroxy-2-naphthoate polyprenyltransferase [Propionibacteriaceae bacterium]